MQKIKSMAFALFLGISAVGLTIPSANAMVILQVANHPTDPARDQLFGALNVDLGSLGFFDVLFFNGACGFGIESEGLCVDPSAPNGGLEFDFQNRDDAIVAAQALLDQVFIDSIEGPFDTRPVQTAGCATLPSESISCLTIIPYASNTDPGQMDWVGAYNVDDEQLDQIRSSNIPIGVGTDGEDLNFAKFTWVSPPLPSSVPEPTSLALMSLGLFGLGFNRRKRNR